MNKLCIFGEHEENTIQQIERICALEAVYKAVLCADGHLGYTIPVGGVVAMEKKICPNGVGYDIACGNKAVLTDAKADEVRSNIYRNMNEIQKHISFGVGRKNKEDVEHELFDDHLWKEITWLGELKQKAREQLGTVGSGNHYVDIFVDELDRIWIGVHFGSRGLGHTIATNFVKFGGGKDGVHAEPVIFDEDTDLGEQYIECMELAGRYAYAGRNWVCERVAKILRCNILEEVHNHHNFAWREWHDDKYLWVIRKGATPAFHHQKGFVGGSMGDISVILEGVDDGQQAKNALYSTIHGAGRVMGRVEAAGKKDKRGNVIREPAVKKEEMDAWIKREGVELRGAYLDEAPQCYRRLPNVLAAHASTIKILHTLKPIGVCMASRNEIDPYKD